AAKCHAVDGGNHRHGEIAPTPGSLLWRVRDAVSAIGQRVAPTVFLSRHASESTDVQTGAERTALAVQHHGAQARLGSQPILGGEDALDHRAIECVHLVGSVQPYVGDAFGVKVNHDPIVHRLTPHSGLIQPYKVRYPLPDRRVTKKMGMMKKTALSLMLV